MDNILSPQISRLLEQSSARHDHLCPRQVLGVRMGLAGLAALGLAAPVCKTTALVIIETDGCFADGIEVATGATVGHRTLRIEDIGKLAATFADVRSGRAVRISPVADARQRAGGYVPDEARHYFAQLQGYQIMPDRELFRYQDVVLDPPIDVLVSKPAVRVNCSICGEEIINERQLLVDGSLLCHTCAGQGYYLAEPVPTVRPA